MARAKKAETKDQVEATDDVGQEDNVSNVSNEFPELDGIDITSLVGSVRGRYDKKHAGLGKDVVTADHVELPKGDGAYVLSDEVAFWKPLTGIKGIPYGRIVQISGKPDSGKSTTAMAFMKAAQRSGALVVLWDAEQKFDAVRYKNKFGGNPTTILTSRNQNITEGAKQIAWFVKEAKEQNPNINIFIVWDSVGAALNSAEDDEDDDFSKQPGVTAREINWATKKFNKLIQRYRNTETGDHTIAVCCINQVYAQIGMFTKGDKEKGGQGLEYLSSLIVRLQRTKTLSRVSKGVKYNYGILTKAKVKKNHLFGGEECVAELELCVSSDGIKLAKEIKGLEGIVYEDDE